MKKYKFTNADFIDKRKINFPIFEDLMSCFDISISNEELLRAFRDCYLSSNGSMYIEYILSTLNLTGFFIKNIKIRGKLGEPNFSEATSRSDQNENSKIVKKYYEF